MAEQEKPISKSRKRAAKAKPKAKSGPAMKRPAACVTKRPAADVTEAASIPTPPSESEKEALQRLGFKLCDFVSPEFDQETTTGSEQETLPPH